jgi:phenylalanyl-tRNA synthetase beta chain
MRLPVEWIKEYAPVDADAEEIAQKLTMAGLEVEETAESALGPVLDIKVTPNRGDCLSVVGVARELAAAYNVPLREHGNTETRGRGDAETHDLTSVTIEDPDLCPRYAARIVRGIQAGQSPAWMQARLEAAGMRPINNIVDVTNYVMLEMGQPLHAFDYDTLLERRIVVRRARPGEKITTLDGVERALTPEMLVICDAQRPVAVAGVMGGAETEMSDATTTMLLESAHFHPTSIRRTARALDLRTEASYRFERTVDPEGVVAAADRACRLIAELGIGEVVPGVVDAYVKPVMMRVIPIRPERVSALLGFQVSAETITDVLSRLGFIRVPVGDAARPPDAARSRIISTDDPWVKARMMAVMLGEDAGLAFIIPSWRPDVVREIDLVEEVGRVLGYEHIPEHLPVGCTTQGGASEEGRFAERVRDILVGAGLQEIYSHTLIAPGRFEDPRDADRRIAIRSALSAELSGLRRSLLPGLVDALERNARRGQTPLALFEVGRVFRLGGEGYEETEAVGGVMVGPLVPASWQQDSRFGASDFYTGRGLVERLADGLGIGGPAFARSDDPRLHPGRAASVLLDGKEIGWVGELHPDLAADLTVRSRVIAFELSVEALQAAAEAGRRYAPLSPFPAVARDLAPRVPLNVPYGEVESAVQSAGSGLLERFDLTDVFTGPPLPEGVKSLTLSFTFRAPDRTLIDAEVNDALAQLRAALEERCGATFAG